jgi:hypothetical protein
VVKNTFNLSLFLKTNDSNFEIDYLIFEQRLDFFIRIYSEETKEKKNVSSLLQFIIKRGLFFNC